MRARGQAREQSQRGRQRGKTLTGLLSSLTFGSGDVSRCCVCLCLLMLDAAASEIIISQNTNNFLIVPPALFVKKCQSRGWVLQALWLARNG